MGLPLYAYFASYEDPPIITKINTKLFSVEDYLTLSPGDGPIYTSAIDIKKQLLYFGANTSPGRITKVRISDFTKISSLDLDTEDEYVYGIKINPTTQKAFVALGTFPGRAARIDLETFAKDASIEFPVLRGYTTTPLLANERNRVYFTTSGPVDSTEPSHLQNCSQDPFVRISELQINPNPYILYCAEIDSQGNYAYLEYFEGFILYLAKIYLPTMSLASKINISTITEGMAGAVIAENRGEVIFVTKDIPSKILIFSLTPFDLIETIDLGQDVFWPTGIVYNPLYQKVYFPIITAPITIIEFDLRSKTITKTLLLDPSIGSIVSATIELSRIKLDYLPLVGIG